MDALQALLAKRRDQTMIDELLGEEGLSLYLVHPNGWLLADVVEVRLRLALGKPEVRDFAPGENNEVYLHGYQGTATSTSRDVSQGATFPQISPGGKQSVSGGGSGALKASVGNHRGVTRAENNVVEQTEYGFDHYILGFDTELTAEVRRLGMPHRPLNNLLNKTFDGWTHHSATRTATIDGTLEIQLPRALAESGSADTAHPRPNLTPLPKLPEDAVITGVVFDDTVRIGRDLLARMFPLAGSASCSANGPGIRISGPACPCRRCCRGCTWPTTCGTRPVGTPTNWVTTSSGPAPTADGRRCRSRATSARWRCSPR